MVNCGLVAMVLVMWNQEQRWARHVLGIYLGLATVIVGGFLVWVVLQNRLYQEPIFREHALAMVPVLLAFVVASKEVRSRVFRNHWWPVIASWAAIAATSVGMAVFTQSLEALLSVWAVVALLVISMGILCGLAATTGLMVWYVGSRAIAHLMRLFAAGILRLQRRRKQRSGHTHSSSN